MLQINVAQQLKSPIGTIKNYDVNEVMDIVDGCGLVQGKIRLMHTHRGILAKGTLNTEIELTCSRCLSLFPCPLTLNIEEEFLATIDVASGAPLPLPNEPGCFTIDENHIIDLTEAIRQYALLTIPMKPLCREDCSGLYPACDDNLNQLPCHYPSQPVDPRWSELTKLFVDNNQAQ